MYFKRLEIFGFKSFAEKTTLEFQPGITAVVGPNGCGKSNVFDAIRWVLGEQSPKDLRGTAMEDVIFSGTDQRPALGFSEVSVVFNNESKALPIEYDEVIVTRRLFRSGESEYLLNKNVCRLKDIIELFLGTGVGSDAYSFVQQGRVDLVVAAKPDDRRQIFDEAAGITKYKSKKKEALSKLKETEDNLLRINDIVVEVKRQIATIERQAKKAQRYKEDFEQLKGFELIMAQHHLSRFNEDLSLLAEEARRLQTREEEVSAELKQYSGRLEHETGLIEELDEEINVIKSKQMRLANEIDINTRQITFNEERMANIDDTCSQLEQEKANTVERCKVNQSKIEEIKGILAGVAQAAAEAHSRLIQKRDELGVLVHFIDQAQESIKTYTTEKFALHAQEVRLKNQLTDQLKRKMELLGMRSRLEMDNSKITGEKDQINQKGLAITAAITGVEEQVSAAWQELTRQRQELEQVQLQLAAQENTIDDLEKKKVFLISQKEFIAKMQDQYQGIPDAVVEAKFICAIRPSETQTGIIGKVKSIRPVEGDSTTGPMYEIIYETKYIELDLAHMDDRIAAIDTMLVEAETLMKSLDAQNDERQQAVDQVLKSIQDFEKKLSVLEAQKNDIELETGKIIGELDVITAEFAEVESGLATLQVQEQQLNDSLNGLAGQVRRCQDDIKEKETVVAAKHKEREDFNVLIVQLEGEVKIAVDRQKALEENLSVYTQNLDRDLNDIGRFDQQVKELGGKKAAVNEDIARLTQLIEDLSASVKNVTSELDNKAALKTEMSQRLNGLRQQIRVLEDEIIQSKTARHNQDMRQQEILFQQRSLKERLAQSYKIDLDNLPAIEAPTAEETSAETNEHQLPPEEGAAEVSALPEVPDVPAAPVPQVNYEELAVEIDRLKKRCDSYGAVNLVAIEEFEELKQRFEFLTKQQSDLLTARESLMQTIQKINRTTRQMFADTFTRVNEEFKIYFRMLFGGGEAELILLDPENALESGIDIVARPPGKKPQHISLLSGGEKTLTAIALIFGVFKVNPSPFCVLDEIDAALDESNVGRFGNLLKEFAKIAQFIIITHNKKTMECADVMYGVTMPERGVSRLVSVKFNQVEKGQAPAAASLPPVAAAV